MLDIQFGQGIGSINNAIKKYTKKKSKNKLKIEILLNKFEFIFMTPKYFSIVI